MTKLASPFVRRLVDLLVMDWAGTQPKRMFGHEAWFAHGNIFAFLEDDDAALGARVAVKLRDDDFRVAMALPGALPFTPGGEASKNWVVLPAGTCATEDVLELWLRKAYEVACSRRPKVLKNRGRAWLD